MNEGLAKSIWNDKLKVSYGDTEGYGEYKLGGDTLLISSTLLGGGAEGSAKLAAVFAHEGTHAFGNRVEGIAHMQAAGTYDVINRMFDLKADGQFSNEMINGMLDSRSWVENTGDTDYWKMTWGGQLINDGQGWLKDENGMYINIDGTKSEVLDESKALGGTGIETGLMNIIAGTGGQKWDSFTAEEKLIAQQLMSDTGMTMDKAGFWNHNGKGQEINMYNFLSASGTNVSDVIFKSYYNNTVDSQLAGVFGIDLGFERNNAVPEILSEKYSSLVTEHLQNTSTPASLKDKYKFTIYNNEGIGTELFNIDENNPFLDDLIKQNNPNLNSVINSSGCNFMTTLAVPQLLTGNVFNAAEIQNIWDTSTNKKYFNDEGEELPWLQASNSNVNNPDLIAELVFNKLNYSNLELRYGWSGKNFDLIGSKVRVPYSNTGHWLLSDSYFNYLYNPANLTGKTNREDNVYLRYN